LKKLMLALFLICTAAPAQEIKTTEFLAPPKVVSIKHDYECVKGEKKILYRLSYKEKDGVPPCKLYVLYTGKKTKKIADSKVTSEVCNEILDRIVKKLITTGMTCTEIFDVPGNVKKG